MVPQAARCDAAESRSTLAATGTIQSSSIDGAPRRESGTHASDDPTRPPAKATSNTRVAARPLAAVDCHAGQGVKVFHVERCSSPPAAVVRLLRVSCPPNTIFSPVHCRKSRSHASLALVCGMALTRCHLCDPPFFSANHIFASLNDPPTARARPLLVCSSCG